jgi:hypothetical protein
MALDSEQLAWTARIARESLASVTSAVTLISADQETILGDDIDLWVSVENSFVRLKGGRGGVDFDNERKRAAIFYRVREMLGYPFINYFLDAEVMELVELEVGQNFG